MAHAEERMQILKMIEDGKVSAADGADLLRALDKSEGPQPPEPLHGATPPRWFRVVVTDTDTGRNKVNVNIPMGLVNVGIKMGARFAPEVEGAEYEQIMEAIRSGRQGKIIDIMDDDDSERVEIFIE